MNAASRGGDRINDPATLLALERLAESRLRLAGWTTQMVARMGSRVHEGGGGFQPRSATLQMLMSLGLSRLPWIRWAFSALMLWRSWRRR